MSTPLKAKGQYTPEIFIVPSLVMLDPKLQPVDSKVYAVISWFEQMEKGICIASNATIAKIINSHVSTVGNSISRLKDQGHLTAMYDDETGLRKYLITMIHLSKSYPSPNGGGGLRQTAKGASPNGEHNIKREYKKSIVTDPALASQVRDVYETYLKCFKFKELSTTDIYAAEKRYKLTPKRRDAIKIRLKDAGFNMLKAAIIAYSQDKNDFYTGGGNRGWWADLEKYICRNYEIVEKGANLYEQSKSGKMQGDDWENLR